MTSSASSVSPSERSPGPSVAIEFHAFTAVEETTGEGENSLGPNAPPAHKRRQSLINHRNSRSALSFTSAISQFNEAEIPLVEISPDASHKHVRSARKALASRFALHTRDLRFLTPTKRNFPFISFRKLCVLVNLEGVKGILSREIFLLLKAPAGTGGIIKEAVEFLREMNRELENDQKRAIRSEFPSDAQAINRRPPFEFLCLEYSLQFVLRELENGYEKYSNRLISLLNTNSLSTLIQNETAILMRLLELRNELGEYSLELKEMRQALKDGVETIEDSNNLSALQESWGFEELLESNWRRVEELENETTSAERVIDLTEKRLNLRLNISRNSIMRISLLVSVISLAVAIVGSLAGIGGINLKNHLEDSPWAFFVFVAFCVACGFSAAWRVIRFSQRRNIYLDLEEADPDDVMGGFQALEDTGKRKKFLDFDG